jgi:hypothetical protein
MLSSYGEFLNVMSFTISCYNFIYLFFCCYGLCFKDLESGLAEYRCVVYQRLHQGRSQLWPPSSGVKHIIAVNQTSPNTTRTLDLTSLTLVNGASYIFTVIF